jgi:uncharacterized protein YeaO (DUF488 family)
MGIVVRTAHLSNGADDYLDITRGGAERSKETGGHRGMGEAFAPSRPLLNRYLGLARAGNLTDRHWLNYVRAYVDEMRVSYTREREAWDKLLSLGSVTLCCACKDATRCHRGVLAGPEILQKMGAKYMGEI